MRFLVRRLSWPLLLAGLQAGPAAGEAPPFTRLDFLGEARLPTGMRYEGAEVGGLSSLSFDSGRGVFYALSDDGGERAPARFYTLSIDVEDGALGEDDVRVEAVTTLRDERGKPFPPRSLDPEGFVLSPGGTLFLSSEGGRRSGEPSPDAPPFVRELRLDGWSLRDLPLPGHFLPGADGRTGVRPNQGFEALTVTPDGAQVITAVEGALVQDGPAATLDEPSPARILVFDTASGRARAEHLYWVDALPAAPRPPTGAKVGGLVELLALDNVHFLALERAYVEGVGFSLRLYLISLAGAEDVSGRDRLAGTTDRIAAAQKTLLLDFAELGLTLDNVEGMSWGPVLADGRRTLLFVSDNNFSVDEITQVFAFAASDEPMTIPVLQGRSHRSPYAGSWVWGLPGVVSAVDSRAGGFWLQDSTGDGDPATSDGLFVVDPAAASGGGVGLPRPGTALELSGRVEEAGRPGELTVTRVRLRSSSPTTAPGLPPAVAVGREGRPVPAGVIDDDGLARFEPDSDAIDFYESLEGMRVEVREPVTVGPSDGYGTFTVLADGGADAGPRTARGGLLRNEGDANPERILVDSSLLAAPVRASVGDRFAGPITGLLDYRFGGYRLVATEPPRLVAGGLASETTALRPARRKLTVATFNLENFSLVSPAAKRARLAEIIARALGAPDIVALQEVQDDSGPADDGVVSAQGGLGALIEAVAAAGGPRYEFQQIDPVNNQEGGQPGGNIRVAYLFHPERVRLAKPPSRIGAGDPCFTGSPASGYEGSRLTLAAEVVFTGKTLFLVNNHWTSKSRDDRLFGARQPPQRGSEPQRLCQARRMRAFVSEILDADPKARVIVLGDLNEHEGRPPLAALEEAGLVDLVRRLPEPDRYTYVFEGVSQVLDHVLVSPALAKKGSSEIDVVHVNAEFADTDRGSDHDPVVVRVRVK